MKKVFDLSVFYGKYCKISVGKVSSSRFYITKDGKIDSLRYLPFVSKHVVQSMITNTVDIDIILLYKYHKSLLGFEVDDCLEEFLKNIDHTAIIAMFESGGSLTSYIECAFHAIDIHILSNMNKFINDDSCNFICNMYHCDRSIIDKLKSKKYIMELCLERKIVDIRETRDENGYLYVMCIKDSRY